MATYFWIDVSLCLPSMQTLLSVASSDLVTASPKWIYNQSGRRQTLTKNYRRHIEISENRVHKHDLLFLGPDNVWCVCHIRGERMSNRKMACLSDIQALDQQFPRRFDLREWSPHGHIRGQSVVERAYHKGLGRYKWSSEGAWALTEACIRVAPARPAHTQCPTARFLNP